MSRDHELLPESSQARATGGDEPTVLDRRAKSDKKEEKAT